MSKGVIHVINIYFAAIWPSEVTAFLFAPCVCVSLSPVCCVAVKDCLECRQRQRDRGNKSTAPNNYKTQDLMLNAVTSTKV